MKQNHINQDELFKVVEIEINSQCNLACSYCPNREFERKEKGEMTISAYQKIIKQLVEVNFKGRVSHEFYGEPTLHPDLVTIMEITRESLPEVKIELYSNGTKLTPKYFRNLLKAGVDEFIITKHIGLKTIVFEETMKELSANEMRHVKFRDHSAIYMTNRGGSLPDIGGKKQELLPCFIPSFLITITVEGNVLPCFEDFFQNHPMGNIFEEHISDIWNKEDYKRLRSELKKGLRHKYKTCTDCNRIQTMDPGSQALERLDK